ncbi:MAG TPA: iron donor protein CyaY [Burkholderiales bacterium]|nr:iron donor protein CyaY [Burkholderiales bacterium]
MSPSEFDALADAALGRIERALEASGVDADLEWKGDGVLELAFEDGARIVVNRHRAAQEIWVAARSGGFHYRWDGASWRDTRDASELFAALSKLVSTHGGKPVRLSPAS